MIYTYTKTMGRPKKVKIDHFWKVVSRVLQKSRGCSRCHLTRLEMGNEIQARRRIYSEESR
jgi:hypothetical protein